MHQSERVWDMFDVGLLAVSGDDLQAAVLAPHAAVGGLLLVVGVIAGAWAIKQRRAEWVAALAWVPIFA